MSSLINLQISQTFPGLIKTNDEAAIDGTLRTLQDGAGNNLPMEVSTAGVNFTGTVTGTPNTTYDYGAVGAAGNISMAMTGSDATNDVVVMQAGTNITLTDNGSNTFTIDAAGGGGGTTLYPGRISATGQLGTTSEGPYGFFSNQCFFHPIFLKAGEVVDSLQMEITAAFTTTTMNLGLYTSQIPSVVTNLGYATPFQLVGDYGSFDASVTGIKTQTGATYTASYTGIYYIGFNLIGSWDGTIRQSTTQKMSNNIIGYYIEGGSRGFEGASSNPLEPHRISGNALSSTYANNANWSSTSIQLMMCAKTAQTLV